MRRSASARAQAAALAAREAAFPLKLRRDAVRLLWRGHVRQSELADPWRTPSIASREWAERVAGTARAAGIRARASAVEGRQVIVLCDPDGRALADPASPLPAEAEQALVERAEAAWGDVLVTARTALLAETLAELERMPDLPRGGLDAATDHRTLVRTGRVVVSRSETSEPAEQRWQLHLELLAARDGLVIARTGTAAATLTVELAHRDGRPFGTGRTPLTPDDLRARARAEYGDVLARALATSPSSRRRAPGAVTAAPPPAIGGLLRRPGQVRAA